MTISILIIKQSDGTTSSYYKALDMERGGIYICLNKSRNLEYCNWFIDNTKRV